MSTELPIIGVLLAAGYSTRFGSNKLMHRLADGSPVAARAARNLIAALPRSIAVVRPGVPEVEAALRAEGLGVSVCANARSGMGASLAYAVQYAGEAQGYVIALADMPFILPATIGAVAERLRAGDAVVAPRYAGERGHPVGFSGRYRAELAILTGDQGARDIIRRDAVTLFNVSDPGVIQDIDVPSDLPRYG
jgi:molybdenum cofactor cytidylyltransferase